MLALLPIAFLSCDNFDKGEYVIYPEGETSQSTPITNTQEQQTILLEDYTGWRCVNCPAAAALLTDLQTKYGDKLVAMSVHAGSFAEPGKANNYLDFRTEYGNKWNSQFGLNAYPIGIINRLDNGSTKGVQKDDWDSKISSLLSSTEHLMNINLGAEKRDNHFIVSTQIKALKEINFATLISIVVLEDGIVGVQMNSDPTYGDTPKISDYVFNHVLRTNGRIDLTLKDSFSQLETIEKNYSLNIDPSWNTDNCKIVVFVTNSTNGEVIQCNEIEIK